MRVYKLFGYAPKNSLRGFFAGFVAAENRMTAEVEAKAEFKKPWLNIELTEIPLNGYEIVPRLLDEAGKPEIPVLSPTGPFHTFPADLTEPYDAVLDKAIEDGAEPIAILVPYMPDVPDGMALYFRGIPVIYDGKCTKIEVKTKTTAPPPPAMKKCKKCDFECVTQPELMLHYRTEHPKPKG